MIHVIGYAYVAAIHCPDCTARDWLRRTLQTTPQSYAALDEHALPNPLYDREGNEVSAVFSTDEGAKNENCDDCQTKLLE